MMDKRLIKRLLKKLLWLCSDRNWQTKYAAMLGLREIIYVDFDERQIHEILSVIYMKMLNEDGRVRWASIPTLLSFFQSFQTKYTWKLT